MTGLPRAIDLFCGAGGATKGLQRAGFHVTGIDIKPQPRYCGDLFIQADALRLPVRLEDFDLIWASPPCQFHTQMRASWRAQGFNDRHVNLLTPTIAAFRGLSVPWIIENVVGAGHLMRGALCLHGGLFGLQVHRPRLFLSSFLFLTPQAPATKHPVGVYDNRPRGRSHSRTRTCFATGKKSEMRIARTLEEAQAAMGMDWADWHETKEAVPPAYAEFIGREALRQERAMNSDSNFNHRD
jgi:DNA (cytosine-5)-methyltransferase 1